jgi:RHS repeat-associated protein
VVGAVGDARTFRGAIVEALRDTDNDLVVDDPLYYHQDDLFSVYAITDATGAVVERYDYSDYGEVTVQRADGTAKPEEYWLGNRHTYTGRLVERNTGMLQHRHRYMAPAIGRFVQRDPLGGWADAANLGSALGYAGSGPIIFGDPFGLQRSQLGDPSLALCQARPPFKRPIKPGGIAARAASTLVQIRRNCINCEASRPKGRPRCPIKWNGTQKSKVRDLWWVPDGKWWTPINVPTIIKIDWTNSCKCDSNGQMYTLQPIRSKKGASTLWDFRWVKCS